MRRRPSTSRSTLAAAVLAAFAALAAPATDLQAAGLGRLTVQSALGQPLRAEVEVTSLSAQEAQSLGARLASPEAFAQAGLQYSAALNGIRLLIEPRDGRTFIRVSSSQPVNEPFVDLLIELTWSGGKLLREYTFLLDPPAVASASAPAAASSPAAVRPAPAVAAAATAPGSSSPAARAAPASAGRSADADRAAPSASQVDVRRGDTLSAVAGRVKPADVNLDQAMMAIYKANPTAFAGNINLLKSGASLSIPDASSMAALSADEARTQVRMQTADFSRYRQQLAGAAPTVASGESGSAASGSVTGRVQEGKAPSQGADRLRLSKPEAPASGSGGTAAVGRASAQSSAAEQAVARDAALRESQSRIDALERSVDDLKKLLELRNRAMADLQTQLDETRSAAKSVSGAVSAPVAAPAIAPAAPAIAPAASTPQPSAPPAAQMPSEPAAPTPAGPAAESAPAPPVATATETAKDEPPPKAPEAVAAAPKPQAPPAPVAQPDFLDELLENPLLLPALGGVAALGGGYALYAMRRRRRVERFEDSLIAADAMAPNSLFGATGGQSVDTRQVDLPADGPATQIQATEVDPIEEANVYVAYGREAQAEDILREGMKRNPDRQAIRHRLLELYAARSDRTAFEALARELMTMTEGQGEDWDKASELGRSIDPNNPLYAAVDHAQGNGTHSLPVADLDFHMDAPPAGGVSDEAARFAGVQEGLGSMTQPGSLSVTRADDIPSDLGIPSLDLTLDLPAAERFQESAGLEADRSGAKEADSLLSRVPDLPDSLDLDLDLAALEAISRIDTPAQPDAPLARADLGFDLDLDGGAPAGQGAADEAGGADSPRWQEMATKLDLASAYEEIGDKEGARELLQEVVAGGDAQQQTKAREMLAKLA